MSDTLVAAREAIEGHAWEKAREAFLAADREGSLTPADLRLLADAAWWSGHPDEAVDALERAYAGFVEAGDNGSAGVVAFWLTYFAMRRGAGAVGAGWMSKAERLLEGEPDSAAHAWLHFLRMIEALMVREDLQEAISHGERAVEVATEHGVASVLALARSFQGYALIFQGHWREGMALMDEVTAAAVAGELDPHSACNVYCNTIACCATMADYRRAGEWTTEAERWMQRQALGGYPGVCRVHRAELKKLHGSYPEAEQEARMASEELERFHLLDAVGFAHYEIGEIRLRMGDLDAAEKAFVRAYEYGWHSQPGLALLKLAQGDVPGAEEAISSALKEGSDAGGDSPIDRLGRARLLPARVTIALAVGDLEAAARATNELEQIAAHYEQPALHASALTARGALELHQGQPMEAIGALDEAWRLWRDIDLPYESARSRVLLGRARQASGDEGTARMDLTAARSVLNRLGAVRDLEEADEWLGGDPGLQGGGGRRVTKTFVFTDIVTSTDLVGLIGDGAWEDLLRWHDRALRAEFARHGGHEVRHTGDGFFIAFDSAADAVNAAVAVQRRLADHRREHGFAPWVRIGVHTDEATLEANDYSGQGVHLAARIGDLGEREEIVVSADVLEAAQAIRYPVSQPRTVNLKGIAAPVAVHTVDWR